MVKLLKKHPFVKAALELERKEIREGISDEVVSERKRLKKEFPELFEQYMNAKRKRTEERKNEDAQVKKEQMRMRGCEAVSYFKQKREAERKSRRGN